MATRLTANTVAHPNPLPACGERECTFTAATARQSRYERNTALLQRSDMGLLRKHELTSSQSLRQMSAGSR